MTDVHGKAVWVGFTTEPAGAPKSLVQDALPADTPTPTPKPEPAPAPTGTMSELELHEARRALVSDIKYGRAKDRSMVALLGLFWLAAAVLGGIAMTVIGTGMFNQLTR